jgi:N-formylglutamate amidohydrolase
MCITVIRSICNQINEKKKFEIEIVIVRHSMRAFIKALFL